MKYQLIIIGGGPAGKGQPGVGRLLSESRRKKETGIMHGDML